MIYWWDALPAGSLPNGTWPGVNMTNAGNGWYSYTFTNITSTNLIFNDGANQTADLNRDKTGWYLNGAWYDTNPGNPGTITYYQIQNRWQPTYFLYDGGNGQVKYGANPGTNQAYQWLQEDAGSGYVLLKNRSSGKYIHIENQNGSVQCSTITPGWYSAMWSIAAAPDGWNYIQNRWQTSQWINIEGLLGYAQYSGAQAGWHSAMWKFVNPITGLMASVSTSTLTASLTGDEIANTPTVKLFPNPSTSGYFFIDLPPLQHGSRTTIAVRNIRGKLMMQQNITGSSKVQHHLPAGVYFINILSGQLNESRKLIVQ